MKQKMIDRLLNYAGNPKPKIVQRVQVCSVTENENGDIKEGPVTTGFLVANPNQKWNIRKEL